MSVRKFQAETWEEALILVRAELGEDAIILFTRSFKKGGLLGIGGKEMVEITASNDPDVQQRYIARRDATLRVDGRTHLARISRSIGKMNDREGSEIRRTRTDRIQRTLVRSVEKKEETPETRAAPVPAKKKHPASAAPPTSETPSQPTAPAVNTGARVDATVDEDLLSEISASPDPAHADAGYGGTYGRGRQPTTGLPNKAGLSASPAAAKPGDSSGAGPGRPPAPSADATEDLRREVRDLKDHVLSMASSAGRAEADCGHAPGVYARLVEAEAPEAVARDVAACVAQALSKEQLADKAVVRGRVIDHLRRMIPIAGEIAIVPGSRRLVALVGATGVGKTTTIAKLAANLRLTHGLNIGIVTVDTYRIAAVDQLRTISEIISVPLQAVTSPKELGEALGRYADMDLVFLDTAGRAHRDALRLSELRAFLAVSKPDETHLVMPLVASPATMLDVARTYAPLGINRVLYTKLDEAVNLGGVLGVSRVLGCPVSYVTAGQDIPEDIEPANAERLATDIFDGPCKKP